MTPDDPSFEQLFVRFSPDVYRFAFHLCGDRDEAEDITSETFVRAWTSAGEIRQSTAKSYLLTIARNLFLHERRRIAPREPIENVQAASPQGGPGHDLEQNAQLEAVRAALAGVPEGDRTALLLYSVEDLTYAEIAEVLGISLVAVKARIHRARLALAGIRTEWR